MKKVADEVASPADSVASPEPAPRQWVPRAEYMKLFELGPDPSFFEDTRELGGFVECPLKVCPDAP